MAVQNYSINRSRAPFSTLDDDDDITSAFMNSSSATYLAADKLPPSYEQERAVSEAENTRNNLLQQIRKVEQHTLDSSKRSLGMLIESEKVGIETAQDLSVQREKLENTENRLDDINSTLKDTQKNINGIKSVFSSIKQWWGTPKQPPAEKGNAKSPVSPTAVCSTEQSNPVLSKNLSSAVENSQLSLQFSGQSQSHPALRLRGLEEEDDGSQFSSDFRATSQKVNQRLDDDLVMMSSGLSRLKELAHGLGDEIGDHNAMLDRIQTKADKAEVGITTQNAQMKRILKR